MEIFNGYKNNTKPMRSNEIYLLSYTVFDGNLSSGDNLFEQSKKFCHVKENDKTTEDSNHFTALPYRQKRGNPTFKMKKYQFKLKTVNVPIELFVNLSRVVCVLNFKRD